MGFERAFVENPSEQESKLFGVGASSDTSFMASHKSNNHSTQMVLDQHQHHHQQQHQQLPVLQQIHPSHHQLQQDHQQNINQISFGMMQSSSSSSSVIPGNFMYSFT